MNINSYKRTETFTNGQKQIETDRNGQGGGEMEEDLRKKLKVFFLGDNIQHIHGHCNL